VTGAHKITYIKPYVRHIVFSAQFKLEENNTFELTVMSYWKKCCRYSILTDTKAGDAEKRERDIHTITSASHLK
jgi:hypothetical protein